MNEVLSTKIFYKIHRLQWLIFYYLMMMSMLISNVFQKKNSIFLYDYQSNISNKISNQIIQFHFKLKASMIFNDNFLDEIFRLYLLMMFQKSNFD